MSAHTIEVEEEAYRHLWIITPLNHLPSLFLSVCLSLFLSFSLSLFLFIYFCFFLSLFFSLFLSVCVSLFIYFSFFLSVFISYSFSLSLCLSLLLSLYFFLSLSLFFLFLSFSLYFFIYFPFFLSLSVSPFKPHSNGCFSLSIGISNTCLFLLLLTSTLFCSICLPLSFIFAEPVWACLLPAVWPDGNIICLIFRHKEAMKSCPMALQNCQRML